MSGQESDEQERVARECRDAIFAAMREIDDESNAREMTFTWDEGALHCFTVEPVGVSVYVVDDASLVGKAQSEHRAEVRKVWIPSALIPTLQRSIQCWRELRSDP